MRRGHLRLAGYRMPTEAEWEFSCRSGAGTSRHYGHGESLLPRYAWSARNSGERAWAVGRLRPNELGLFDTLGNASEWCEDPALLYETGQRNDIEHGPYLLVDERSSRILRGASLFHQPGNLRSAARSNAQPGSRDGPFGLRPARTLPD
jgi:formylglycine-generating enzyme required for sulfatase activity